MKRLFIMLAVVAGVVMVGMIARAALTRLTATAADVPVLQVRPGPFVRTITAEGYLKPVKATPLTAPSEGRSLLIAWLAEDGATVKKGDVVIRFDNDEAVRALADGKSDQAAADIRIVKEKVQVAGSLNQRQRAAALTTEEIKHAKALGKIDPRYFPRNEVIESQIDEALLDSRLKQTNSAGDVEKQLAKSRVALLDVDRQKAEIQRDQATRTLKALEVRAPHDGTVVIQRSGWAQRMFQSGDRAFPGMRIAEIATTDSMEAEVAVLEADAGGLVAGKRATITLDARPEVVWEGEVKRVDPFPKPQHPENPAQYFGAILSIQGGAAGFKPGQRLRTTIVLDELPSALVVPRQAVGDRDGGSYVFRRRAFGRFEAQRVTLGPGTVGRVVVTAGLSPGDAIALRDPSRSADDMVSGDAADKKPGTARPQAAAGGGRR